MTRRRVLYGVSVFLLALFTGAAIYINSLLPIITGYAAKNLCSGVFVSQREPGDLEETDLNFSFIKFTSNEVNYSEKSVTSRFLWGKSKAVFREGFGVTLIRDIKEESLYQTEFPFRSTQADYSRDTIAWPLGNIIADTVTGINLDDLKVITNRLIDSNAYKGNAFAFIVIHKGIPVAEGYKPQFNQNTRFISWSMAKSFINALVGILVNQDKLNINQNAGFEEWDNDERNQITLNNLMQMQSGLGWNEDYGNRSDVTVMLHCEGDMSHFAIEQPLDFAPGTHWYYSSGTTNIVSELLRRQFNSDSSYYSFASTHLFNKIGTPDVVFEVDASGSFVGSSYLYATARDYARFGLLYLNDGVFNGERILPEGWVDYSTSVASESNGEYGAFFWLNKGKEIPSAPDDMYMCVGHDGQRIFILPTEELIVVVLGYSPSGDQAMDFDRLISDILEAI